MTRLRSGGFLGLLLLALLTLSCYEKGGGGESRDELRDYIAKATIVEGQLTDGLGAVIVKYPAAFEESAPDDAVAPALIGYWTEGLPIVRTARREWLLLTPPPAAEQFHTFVGEYLGRTESFFEKGPSVLQGTSRAALGELLLEMAAGERDSDRMAEWFDELLDESR